MMKWLNGLGMVVAGVVLSGCAPRGRVGGQDGAALAVPRYATAFDAARATLRNSGFILERVDARAGVITTQPKTTAGLLTPWDREQSTVTQEVEDLLQRQQRVVRVEFEGVDGAALGAENAARVRVHVVVQRLHIPGHKLEPEAIRQSSFYLDPVLAEREMQPNYAVAIKQDELLAARLTRLIEERLASVAAVSP